MPAEVLVEAKIKTDGLIVDGVAEKKGRVVRVPSAQRDKWVQQGHVEELPMCEVKEANRLVCNRVCQPGDIVPAASVAHAVKLHENGTAVFVNAKLFGVNLRELNTRRS